MNTFKILFFSFVLIIFENILLFSGFNPLPDTGQTKCYNNNSEIACPNIGESFYGQDGNYLKLQQKFKQVEKNGDKIIIDENTGLIWMKSTADINKDGKITYSDKLNWKDANDYCENLNYAGYDDWKLPTLFELSTISNFGKFNLAIDENFFNCEKSFYWSSTKYSDSPTGGAWTVYPYYGDVNWVPESERNLVRCVRNQVKFPNYDRFELLKYNEEIVVKDKLTGLMWQKGDDGIKRTWEQALNYCYNLKFSGFADWRLPDIQELRSILIYSEYNPAVAKNYFDCKSDFYWSSTTNSETPSTAWTFYFKTGNDDWYNKSYDFYVRCVRGGLGMLNCSIDNITACDTEEKCKSIGKYWYDNKCNLNPYGEINIKSGWNLKVLPVKLKEDFDISHFNIEAIISVWKWSGNSWNIWSANTQINNLIKKYGLTSFKELNAGEGFWLKAIKDEKIDIGEGDEYGIEELKIIYTWNLLGIGKNLEKANFTKFGKINILWKWRENSWKVWSPNEDIMNFLKKYKLGEIKVLEKGEGFWLNK